MARAITINIVVVIVNDSELVLARMFAKGHNAVGVLRDDRVILSIDESVYYLQRVRQSSTSSSSRAALEKNQFCCNSTWPI